MAKVLGYVEVWWCRCQEGLDAQKPLTNWQMNIFPNFKGNDFDHEIRDFLSTTFELVLFRTFSLVSQFLPLYGFTNHETTHGCKKNCPPPKTNEYTLKIAGWKMRVCPFKTVPVQEDFNSFVFRTKTTSFSPPFPPRWHIPSLLPLVLPRCSLANIHQELFLPQTRCLHASPGGLFGDKKWDVPQITNVGPRNGKSL